MIVTYLGTTKAFIDIDDGEEYPETIRVKVDKNRTFIKHTCKNCSRIFYSRKGYQGNFCSEKCFSDSKNANLICPVCGKEFKKLISHLKVPKHGIYFCSRECKDFGQSIEGGIIDIQLPHYKDGFRSYSERAMRYQKRNYGYNFCEICDERNELFLIVHHKDENRENNNIENLRVICANCHVRGHRTGQWNK